MAITEQKVQNAVTAYLGTIHYRATKLKSAGEHGVDIRAVHTKYARYFLVECKGDSARQVVSANSGKEVRFLLGLGQIVTRMHPGRGYYYGLAMPAGWGPTVHRRLRRSLLKALRLHIFFVDAEGKVEHVTWKDLDDEGA